MPTIDVVIETPKGSAEKYSYDAASGFFKLKKILPAGMVFPFDFGFIPNTKGDDGDPLDILVISEFKSFAGSMMECFLTGAIIADQTEKDKTIKNNRFIAIPATSKQFTEINTLKQLPKNLLHEIEQFFINYNALEKKTFKPLKHVNGDEAFKLIKFNSNG